MLLHEHVERQRLAGLPLVSPPVDHSTAKAGRAGRHSAGSARTVPDPKQEEGRYRVHDNQDYPGITCVTVDSGGGDQVRVAVAEKDQRNPHVQDQQTDPRIQHPGIERSPASLQETRNAAYGERHDPGRQSKDQTELTMVHKQQSSYVIVDRLKE